MSVDGLVRKQCPLKAGMVFEEISPVNVGDGKRREEKSGKYGG